MTIEKLLHKEIENEFKDLVNLKLGSDEYKTTVDGLTKLVDRAIKIDELNIDEQNKIDSRETEANLKQQQIDNERKDQKVRNGISIAGIVIPVAVTIWGTIKTLKFEQEGTITTNAGREFMKRIFSRK